VKAKDVMTSPVISIEPDATVSQAIAIMLRRRVSGLPVIDKEGRLVGMLTEGDLLRRVETGTQRQRPRLLELLVGAGKLAEEYTHSHGRKVDQIMSDHPLTISEETPLNEVVSLMEKQQIKRVPVVQGEHVVGIVSRANLIHALAAAGTALKPIEQSDQAIRASLMAELGKQRWVPMMLIDPIVHDGVVELWGSITDQRARQALIVAAENVPGVKGVRDHLVWVG
jgi:CBS domain-containing protein